MSEAGGAIVADETVAPGRHSARVLEPGQVLRIVDLEGCQGVDFLCYNADRPEERYHAPNTLKAARTLKLTAGHALYSDEARSLMTIVADDYGGHDTIGGCCSIPGNAMLYGAASERGCRENFLEALGTHGLGWRDIVPNVNFFCDVPVNPDRSLVPGAFAQGHSKAGDHVDLRAEMRVLVAVSNCPQVNNPCNDGRPTPIRLLVGTRA